RRGADAVDPIHRRPRRRCVAVRAHRPLRPGQHRQPGRVVDARARRDDPRPLRFDVGDRLHPATRGRPCRPPSRHLTGARAARLGTESPARGRSQANHRMVPQPPRDPRLLTAPILVTGAIRTGTTWVGEVLARNPELEYVWEPYNPLVRAWPHA